jgi:hypothetical protein
LLWAWSINNTGSPYCNRGALGTSIEYQVMEQTVVLKPFFVTVTFLEPELLELFQKNSCFAHPFLYLQAL